MEEAKRQVQVIQEMMVGYHNMANDIQQQSNNLNCQIEEKDYAAPFLDKGHTKIINYCGLVKKDLRIWQEPCKDISP